MISYVHVPLSLLENAFVEKFTLKLEYYYSHIKIYFKIRILFLY